MSKVYCKHCQHIGESMRGPDQITCRSKSLEGNWYDSKTPKNIYASDLNKNNNCPHFEDRRKEKKDEPF